MNCKGQTSYSIQILTPKLIYKRIKTFDGGREGRENEFSPAPVHGVFSSQEEVTISKEVMSACVRNGICMRDGGVKFAQVGWTFKNRL